MFPSVSDYLQDYSILIEKSSPQALQEVLSSWSKNLLGHRELFISVRSFMIKLLPEFDFDQVLRESVNAFTGEDKYSLCVRLSSLYYQIGEYEASLLAWGCLLGSELPAGVVPGCGMKQIDQANVIQYDEGSLHQEIPLKLSLFALSACRDGVFAQNLRVLDICCGSGLNGFQIRPFAQWQTGTDLCLDGLRHRQREAVYDQLLEGDVRDILPQLQGEADLLLCNGATYFFERLDWLFEAATRLLAPGGSLVFNDFFCPDTHDAQVTQGGSYRWCHSSRYIHALAAQYGLAVAEKTWLTTYNLPSWAWRLVRQR